MYRSSIVQINSTYALLIIVGDTVWWGKPVKTADAVFSSRIIGVEIYCGPIRETCYFVTDNLVDKGANTNIEVQRKGNCNCSFNF